MLVMKLNILHLIAFTSMFIDVSSLKCFHCDSREQNCTAQLPHSQLVECNYQYFENVGLQHLVSKDSSFVCITAHAKVTGQAELIFKNCAPKIKNPCQVVMPENDDGSSKWQCLTCEKDACNAGNAQMVFSLSLGLFFSWAFLITM